MCSIDASTVFAADRHPASLLDGYAGGVIWTAPPAVPRSRFPGSPRIRHVFAVVWIFSVAAAAVALVWAVRFYRELLSADEGTEAMVRIAQSVRNGADAYLKQQNRVVGGVLVGVAGLLAVAAWGFDVLHPMTPIAFLVGGAFSALCGYFGMRTATAAGGRTAAAARVSLDRGLQLAFRSGAVMGLTVVGMGLLFIAAWLAVLYWIIPAVTGRPADLGRISVAMLTFGMGASAQALFARVGGGIFTKAADVGADLVGKVEQSLAEDSPYNPATIADNVGDNVGDVAGMGADLYESYCGSILAASALGVAAYAAVDPTAALRAMMLPMAIAAAGILVSIACIYLVKSDEDADGASLLASLGRGINAAALGVAAASIVLTWLLRPSGDDPVWLGVLPGLSLSIIVGLAAGWAIGNWTERMTSDEYPATRNLASGATTGPATIIIGGVADGMLSTVGPVIVVCIAMVLAFGFAAGFDFDTPATFSLGLYGVGIAAVGMLSTLGITLATDAYGPIADNAGGNAEMSDLEPVVRQRTDALDSLGNTTAATGKGFAIGSAALTALALLAAYVESVRDGYLQWGETRAAEVADGGEIVLRPGVVVAAADPPVQRLMSGVASGDGAATANNGDPPGGVEVFLVNDRDGIPSTELAAAGDRSGWVRVRDATLRDFLTFYDATLINPRVLIGLFLGAMSAFVFCAMTMKSVGRAAEGMVQEVRRQFTENPGILDGTATPDYERPVALSTRAAQREMIAPSLLGLILPIATGLLLGVAGVLGLLAGCLTSGFCLAVFMANSGGSWDNAKKYIEAGNHGGKGSEAHRAAVVGDTVGDPFKDTSGPSLNILIKLMSMVSVVAAGLVLRYSL